MIDTHETVKNRERLYIPAIAAEVSRLGYQCDVSVNSESASVRIDNLVSMLVYARIRHGAVQITMGICSPDRKESVLATETCSDGVYSISPEDIAQSVVQAISDFREEGARVACCVETVKKTLCDACLSAGMEKTMDVATMLACSIRGFTVAFSFSDKKLCHMESMDSRRKDSLRISFALGFPYSEAASIGDVVRGLAGVVKASRKA